MNNPEQTPIERDGRIREHEGEVLPGYEGVNAPVFPQDTPEIQPETEEPPTTDIQSARILTSAEQNAHERNYLAGHNRRIRHQIYDPPRK